ncbi:MAG: hypothetical protein ACQEQZ_08515 [Pseudomonadota bacterium]
MNRNDRAQLRLNRWFQTLLVVVAIGLLIMIMLNKGLLGDAWGWRQAERDVLIKRFNENLLLAKTEWLRRGRPDTVDLTTAQNRFVITMNAHGWPSVDNGCLQLWQMLAGGRYQPKAETLPWGCQYQLNENSNEQSFQLSYLSKSGQLK